MGLRRKELCGGGRSEGLLVDDGAEQASKDHRPGGKEMYVQMGDARIKEGNVQICLHPSPATDPAPDTHPPVQSPARFCLTFRKPRGRSDKKNDTAADDTFII